MRRQEINGLRLACLYSLGCPDLRERGGEVTTLSFLSTPNPSARHTQLVRGILERIEPFLFYALISGVSEGGNVFQEEIVRAFWLSSRLLKPMSRDDFRSLASRKDIPPDFPKRDEFLIKMSQLIGRKPHHNFSVFLLIKGLKEGVCLPFPILQDINACLVKPGLVLKADSSEVEVATVKLVYSGGNFFLSEVRETIARKLVRKIKIGDWISIHFGRAREVISEEEASLLREITQEAFEFTQEGRS